MNNKNDIWSSFSFDDKPSKSALDYLTEQKENLKVHTKGELIMEIEAVDAYIDGSPPKLAALYMLYVVAPVLGNYRKKILTVAEYKKDSRFPVDIVNHFNEDRKKPDVQEVDFDKEISDILTSISVKKSIESLYKLCLEQRKASGFHLLQPGHAGVLMLNDGVIMNYGVINIENNILFHYTGKGLREQNEVDRLLNENKLDELLSSKHISYTPIENIKRVLS